MLSLVDDKRAKARMCVPKCARGMAQSVRVIPIHKKTTSPLDKKVQTHLTSAKSHTAAFP